MSFHRITVIGYAGSEPEYQVTVTGKDYAYFPLYVNERHGNSERAYRYKIKTWNELSLIVKDHLVKGPVSYTHLDVYKRQPKTRSVCVEQTRPRPIRPRGSG